jgi:hypothetical protein
MKYVWKSILLNYKSWILIFFSIFLIEQEKYIQAVITFFCMIFSAYCTHYYSHFDFWFPLNITHIEHHNHDNWFAHFVEILLELSFFLAMLVFKYLFKIEFLNTWCILYFYLFYTTIHNINYTIFRVNNVHQKHHELMKFNYGPEIFDVIFNTKKNPETDLENTDHYIWNIVILTPIVIFLKHFFKNLTEEWKKEGLYILGLFFTIFFILILFLTADLYIDCGGKNNSSYNNMY